MNRRGMALLIGSPPIFEEDFMRNAFLWSGFLVLVLGASAFVLVGGKPVAKPEQPVAIEPVIRTVAAPPAGMATATFGGGCFWCTEAVFQQLKGVQSVVSGYTGGSVKNPTYEQVCTGTTGHAEALQVTYDPKEISYEELLEVFWKTHDPTTQDQQGNDYRPAVSFGDLLSHGRAEAAGGTLQAEARCGRPVPGADRD